MAAIVVEAAYLCMQMDFYAPPSLFHQLYVKAFVVHLSFWKDSMYEVYNGQTIMFCRLPIGKDVPPSLGMTFLLTYFSGWIHT